jgi:hypothetical protein
MSTQVFDSQQKLHAHLAAQVRTRLKQLVSQSSGAALGRTIKLSTTYVCQLVSDIPPTGPDPITSMRVLSVLGSVLTLEVTQSADTTYFTLTEHNALL